MQDYAKSAQEDLIRDYSRDGRELEPEKRQTGQELWRYQWHAPFIFDEDNEHIQSHILGMKLARDYSAAFPRTGLAHE